jgi:hypothetical protein
VLYAASNLGSLVALIAYPVLVEPNLTLAAQRAGWSWGYVGFGVLAAILGLTLWPAASHAAPVATHRARASWRQRLSWLALAAIPSSLMLGVTNYVTVDLGSAPFLWVAPLALYLLTFVIAFQARPIIPPAVTLTLQAGAVAFCAVYLRAWTLGFVAELAIHLTAFFLTALVCHQALVARRPTPERLTEFYIWMSLGGVVGGMFNAFLAPVLFSQVIEYPAVLVLACLARPWGRGPFRAWRLALLALSAAAAIAAMGIGGATGPLRDALAPIRALGPMNVLVPLLLSAAAIAAILLRDRALPFAAAILALIVASWHVSESPDTLMTARSFFGVLTTSRAIDPQLGEVRILTHGTTLHGAQAVAGPNHCRPLVYYAPDAPIGQVFTAEAAAKPSLSIGVVGLGAGTVATFTRPADTLRFFEIDPLVAQVARDPRNFSYVSQCARGRISYSIGDARLTLAKMPAGAFDVLLIDAFSSDSVPAHLLTVEAARMYLDKLRPGGVVILHLSNRNLDLKRPAQAIAIASGGVGLAQSYQAPPHAAYWTATEEAVIFAKTPAALAPFANDRRWTKADPQGVRPWTDDYTNLFGALVRRLEPSWRR